MRFGTAGLMDLEIAGLLLLDGTSLTITLDGIFGRGGRSSPLAPCATWLPPHPPSASSPCVE
jgi:hypothetical protein